MSNVEFYEMDELLTQYIRTFYSPKMKELFRDLQARLHRGIRITDRDIENALNGALRGAEFDGDWVGRPDDDFDDDDDE